MGRLILFDRGEAGGLYIDPKGVRPIPRFAPPILAHLRAVSDLLKATQGRSAQDGTARDLSVLINKVSNLAVERVEAAIGPLDATHSLVYLSDDDGFTCGSTGGPPIPINWPPVGTSSPEDLVGSGILAPDLVEFVRRATAKGLGVAEILENPTAAAAAVDMKLSDMAAASLIQFAPSHLASIKSEVDRELVSFFHQVIADGRFVDTWTVEPVAVATSIGVKLSDAVIDRILGASAVVGRVGDVANLSIEQGIVIGVVAVVIVVVGEQDPGEIIDRSQEQKF